MENISSNMHLYEKYLSKQRLESYIDPTDQSLERTLFQYSRNIQLCESLYTSLHIVEIVVRNHIYDAIKTKKGDGWLTNFPERWLRPQEINKIKKALQTLKTREKEPDPGRIVAELNFGFWTALFDRYYEHKRIDLWAGIVRKMFPNMPARSDKIAVIRVHLNKIRELRNRVFHYEPIWHWENLETQHANILNTLGWVNEEMKNFAIKNDRFPIIFKTL